MYQVPFLLFLMFHSGPVAQEPDPSIKLLAIRRIYVDTLGEDKMAKALHAMIINALVETKRFIVTENKEKADAILKGATFQKTSQELHATSEGTGRFE